MRVAVDIDSTTLDFQGGWIRAYEHWFDRQVDVVSANSWSGHVSGTHFGTEDEFWHWMTVAGVWWKLQPIRGALGGLYELQHSGFDVVLCTARSPEKGAEAAVQFAYEHGLEIELRGSEEKHLAGADVWIDDSPKVLASLRSKGKTAIRFAQPWNQPHQAPYSAYCWNDVLTIVNELKLESVFA